MTSATRQKLSKIVLKLHIITTKEYVTSSDNQFNSILGPEYGTTEAAWKGVLTEAERLSDVHMKIKDNLCNDVNSQIKTWQKDNFHHTLMQIKERKDMDDLFKKAQKPWAKLLAKVEKAKADYHAACKTERSATNQERNANADSSLSPDQVSSIL